MIKGNLHTHTIYCDGKNTPEELVKRAIECGFSSIGFSGHSFMPYSTEFCARMEDLTEYRNDIYEQKRKYGDIIDVFYGLEKEMYSDCQMDNFDYVIGSVHYFKLDDKYVGFDRDALTVRNVIDTYFGGNGMSYAKEYYKQVARLPEYGKFDIIGHFDIITKHCEKVCFFDTDSKEYKAAAIEAIDALKGKIPFFELNTGAIARGYRTTPYPMPFLIKEFKRMGFGVVLTSDCHDSNYLDCYYEKAAELLRECGFKEQYVLTKNGFTAVEL